MVQTGDFDASNKPTEFEVFYPRPYASPPELKIVAPGLLLTYQITEQRRDGFRVRCTAGYTRFVDPDKNLSRYQARGVPAK